MLKRVLLVLFLCGFLCEGHAAATQLDVLHYTAAIEPDIPNKTIKGTVRIKFVTDQDFVEFDCGALVIDSVLQDGNPLKFAVKDRRVRIELGPRKSKERQVDIEYHGAPKFGIRFFPERNQVYTIFSTSQWLVCIDDPADRATLTLSLSTPMGLTHVANGKLGTQNFWPNGMRTTEWNQTIPIPTYIFGFAVGPYKEVTEKKGDVELRYLATDFSEAEVRRIFRDTPDMLEFFESRAGVKYPGKTYTQVLAAGGVEQEMDAFTALKEEYGKAVLANEQDQWLAAHEFAHQWWGNMVTCRDWNHFWINEGIASFIAAAYLEHRFGRAAYTREIESYRANYEKVKAAGKDKSLVFPDWLHPTREDRILVYDKGAYVIHLLREEVGERAFWEGLRLFTRRHFGKSVVTSDFTRAMQEAAKEKNLEKFFAKWIYLKNE